MASGREDRVQRGNERGESGSQEKVPTKRITREITFLCVVRNDDGRDHKPTPTTCHRVFVNGLLNVEASNTRFHRTPDQHQALLFPLRNRMAVRPAVLAHLSGDGEPLLPIARLGTSQCEPSSPSPPFRLDVLFAPLLSTSFMTSFAAPPFPCVLLINTFGTSSTSDILNACLGSMYPKLIHRHASASKRSIQLQVFLPTHHINPISQRLGFCMRPVVLLIIPFRGSIGGHAFFYQFHPHGLCGGGRRIYPATVSILFLSFHLTSHRIAHR